MSKKRENSNSELMLVKQHLSKVLEEHGHAILKLKASEEKFKTVADYTYNWEYWLCPKGTVLYNSPSCKGLTGYNKDEFHVDPELFFSIVHPEDKSRYLNHRQCSCYTSSDTSHLRFRIITKDGQVRWVAHSCQPVHDSNGQFIGRRASNRNITAQKKAEEKLIRSEERFRLALDAASDGLWDMNLQTREEYFGDNWYRVLGYTEHDFTRQRLTWEKLIHPEDQIKFSSAIEEHLEGHTSRYEVELRMRNKNGNWQWFMARGRVVDWSDEGIPLRIVGTYTDISQSKAYELELQSMKESLEEKVAQRTDELLELNVTLKVLLKKMEQDKQNFEQKMSDKLAKLVDPYLEQLNNSSLNLKQQVLLEMLRANLQELTATFSPSVSPLISRLTPTEYQVADLVKHGKTTQEIADIMHLAPGTVSIHRKSIRKKLGISQQRVNLQAFLNSPL